MRALLLLGGLLLAGSAWAQQPALPGAPQPPATPTQGAIVPVPIVGTDPMLGSRYEVALRSGTVFTGTLTSLSLDALEFDTKELGHLRVLRTDVRQVRPLAAVTTTTETPTTTVTPTAPRTVGLRPSYYDIGSGSRYFFGPSARNLRQGEGVAQDILVFLAGVNYGITDNISIGGYVSLAPGVAPQNQFIMLTPKVGFDVGAGWHLGAGALYLRIPDSDDRGYGVGLLYGVATQGSADNNFSVGLGYGFAGSDIGNTPAIYVAGQRRISRRISLISENYFIAAHSPVGFGLYGVKFNWPRLSLGVASGYVGYSDNTDHNNGYGGYSSDDSFFFFGYVYPVFVDLSFRFGKPYQK
ncbi:MAG: hypothetical protein ACRYG7_37625 [Janthinobacterium lividum]